MSKEKLIALISQEKEIHPNDVRHVIQAFLDKATEYLAEGYRLEFRDFGIFEVVERKEKSAGTQRSLKRKLSFLLAAWQSGLQEKRCANRLKM